MDNENKQDCSQEPMEEMAAEYSKALQDALAERLAHEQQILEDKLHNIIKETLEEAKKALDEDKDEAYKRAMGPLI